MKRNDMKGWKKITRNEPTFCRKVRENLTVAHQVKRMHIEQRGRKTKR